MPILDSATAQAVAEATGNTGEYSPLKPGKYLARLAKVEARENPNKYGLAMWNAEFDEIHNLQGERQPGRQWLNLTAPVPPGTKPHPAYANGPEKWEQYQSVLRSQMKAFFEAFGYQSTSDTDEIVGEWAVITLGVETIQAGPKQGQQTNRVTKIEAKPEGLEIAVDEDEVF